MLEGCSEVGLQHKVCAMCNVVKGSMMLTSMHSARVTLNTAMSRSTGLHV